MKFLLFLVFLTISSSISFGAKFQNYKTEKEKISDGVILEKQIATSTGKIIKEVYKIKVDGNYYEAEKKDEKWQLSNAGKIAFEEAKKSVDSGDSGGGGGGGGC